MMFRLLQPIKLIITLDLLATLLYIVQHLRFESFAPATLPNTRKVVVPLGRAGIYYNNSWLTLTSLFSYISKTNNNSTLNLQHSGEIMATPLTYDIKTWGWTTDLIAHPLKGIGYTFPFSPIRNQLTRSMKLLLLSLMDM